MCVLLALGFRRLACRSAKADEADPRGEYKLSESLDGIISRTRFLLVDSDKAVLEKLERYLLMAAAPKVHVATSPLLALRVMQDRRTPVDCVICPHKQGRISGLEFLQNLRLGRWGGGALRDMKFILMMKNMEESVVQIADSFHVNGYITGELERDGVTDAVVKALTGAETNSPLVRQPVAHLNLGGQNVLLMPLSDSFADLPADRQQALIDAAQAAAGVARILGQVIPIWSLGEGQTGFLAPPQFHDGLANITLDYAQRQLNRTLSVPRELLPDEVTLGARTNAKSDIGAPLVAKSISDDERSDTGAAQRTGAKNRELRDMTYEDVSKVILGFKQLGPEKFLRAFVRSQRVIQKQAGQAVTPVMREYFVSLELLRKALFPDANLRRSGQLFGDLTLTLDQAMMRSIGHLPDLNAPFSINFNVQSVFTKNFEAFLAQAPLDLLTIEFRQPNVVEYFDEYLTARELLRSKGIRIAIDQIFPDTLGLVNLELLGVSMAKIHWGDGAADILRERHRAFSNILGMGIKLVMTRVDETAAFGVGASIGIRKFQGHLVEDLMKKTAA